MNATCIFVVQMLKCAIDGGTSEAREAIVSPFFNMGGNQCKISPTF